MEEHNYPQITVCTKMYTFLNELIKSGFFVYDPSGDMGVNEKVMGHVHEIFEVLAGGDAEKKAVMVAMLEEGIKETNDANKEAGLGGTVLYP